MTPGVRRERGRGPDRGPRRGRATGRSPRRTPGPRGRTRPRRWRCGSALSRVASSPTTSPGPTAISAVVGEHARSALEDQEGLGATLAPGAQDGARGQAEGCPALPYAAAWAAERPRRSRCAATGSGRRWNMCPASAPPTPVPRLEPCRSAMRPIAATAGVGVHRHGVVATAPVDPYPLDVIRAHVGVTGSFRVEEMRYFTGPEIPSIVHPRPPFVEWWYVKAQKVDASVLPGPVAGGPTVGGRHRGGRRRPVRHRGFRSPDWRAFVGDGTPREGRRRPRAAGPASSTTSSPASPTRRPACPSRTVAASKGPDAARRSPDPARTDPRPAVPPPLRQRPGAGPGRWRVIVVPPWGPRGEATVTPP